MGVYSKDKRDIYYRMAKQNGYRARSAYKLIQMDESYKLFESAKNVVDLCGSPGGWTQVAIEKSKNNKKINKIVAVDLQPILPLDGATCIQEDITTDSCVSKIIMELKNNKADLILCDGAPDMLGFTDLDEYFQKQLLLAALSISLKIGEFGASFVGKCFRNEETKNIVYHFKKFFKNVTLIKPKCSRSASLECFLYATDLYSLKDDPFIINCAKNEDEILLLACGSGPDPDITYEISETSVKSKFNPISPPYKKAVDLRKNN